MKLIKSGEERNMNIEDRMYLVTTSKHKRVLFSNDPPYSSVLRMRWRRRNQKDNEIMRDVSKEENL